MVEALFKDFKIAHHNSSPYRPKMNEVVEAANKNIKKIIRKMVVHEVLECSMCVKEKSDPKCSGI